MAYIRKRFGKWQVAILKNRHSSIHVSFHDVKDARKFARDGESQVERGVFENYSGACIANLTKLFCKLSLI